MVILFEPLLRDETLADRLPIESFVLLAEIRNYIETRLAPLKDEIDKEEEEEDAEKPRATMVKFNPDGIGFINYTAPLREKMSQCFDDPKRDIELIWLKFDHHIKSFFN